MPDFIDTIVHEIMKLEPRGVTEQDARLVVGGMHVGDSLFVETGFQGGNGRLVVVGKDEKDRLTEIFNLTRTSSRWHLVYRM
ncbi:hypothetical protein JXA32_07255 [Candidatus Sumerlaeota bacterium]|nr:hypothetical protein [Candidatus Sumerlaeota bacterium]